MVQPLSPTIEPTIKAMAEELAGKFYEESARSNRFRKAFPTWEHYKKGWQVVADGAVKKIPPGWMHHVKLARRLLAEMLRKPGAAVHPEMKERIAAALIADHGKSQRFGQKLAQYVERDDG